MNSYQLLKSIGDIDDNLILEVNEYNKEHRRKKIEILLGLGMAACAALCILRYDDISRIIMKDGVTERDHEIQSSREYTTVAIENRIEINEEYKRIITKLGGRLSQVTRENWTEYFNDGIFAGISNAEYFLSYSKENEVLYGVMSLKLQNDISVDIVAGTDVMTDIAYEELKKTDINGVETAICSLGELSEQEETQYCAILKQSDTIYTIESGESELEEFIKILTDIVKPL